MTTLLVASPAAISPTLGAELLTNGNMETGDPPTGWTPSGGPTLDGVADERTGGAGVQSLSVTSNADDWDYARCSISGQPANTWYQGSMWGRRVTANWTMDVCSHGAPGTKTSTAWVQGWASGFTTGTAPSIALAVTTALSEARGDDASLKAITFPTTLGSVYSLAADYTAQVGLTLDAGNRGTWGGMILNLDNAANPQNFILATMTYLAELWKCVGGTWTKLISIWAPYGNGKILKVIKSGTQVSLWYNAVQIGTTQTISDVGIINNTLCSWWSTYSGNTFANFQVDYTAAAARALFSRPFAAAFG